MPEPTRIRVPLQLRWSDTDQYTHVNNVTYLGLAEEARIRALGLPDRIPASADPRPILAGLGADSYTITAGQRIEYRRELAYDAGSVLAEVWLSRIGSRSFDMDGRILDAAGEAEYAIFRVNLVLMDVAAHRPRALTEHERTELTAHVDTGVAFRSE